MNDWDEIEIEQPESDGGSQSRKIALWSGGAILAVLAAAIAGYVYLSHRPSPSSPLAPEATRSQAAEPETQQPPEQRRGISLPPLAESDALVRDLVANLSAHPALASWLLNKDLVRKFTAAVDNVADGEIPRSHLSFLQPSEPFQVLKRSGRYYADVKSYERYNLATEVFCSLDTQAAARLYHDTKPLIQEAYRELGHPDRNFDDTLRRAIDRLLRTPVGEEELELAPRITTYELVDARWEGLAPVQKLFLRMGPGNERKIQAKLRELAAALDLERSSPPAREEGH